MKFYCFLLSFLLAQLMVVSFLPAADIHLVSKNGVQAPFSSKEVTFAPIRSSRQSLEEFDPDFKISAQQLFIDGKRQKVKQVHVNGRPVSNLTGENTRMTMVPAVSLFLETEIIVIHGEIELFDSARLKQALRLAIQENATMRSLQIVISSPGGLYLEGLRMHNEIREFSENHPNITVTTIAAGPGAWSAGGIIWSAGDRMVITPGSVVGFHPAYNPQNNETTEQFVVELEEIVSGTFENLKNPRPDISESLSEYVRAAFNSFGSGMFFIIDDKGKIDLWEDSRMKLYSQGDTPWVHELDYAFIEFVLRTRKLWQTEEHPGRLNVHFPAFKRFHMMERAGHATDTQMHYAVIPPSIFFDWHKPDSFYPPLDQYASWLLDQFSAYRSAQFANDNENLNTLSFPLFRQQTF